MTQKQHKVGVIVGRFQTPDLHEGHRHLIDMVQNDSETLCVVVGLSAGVPDKRNPMDFTTRELMIKSHYPKAVVDKIIDQDTDEEWSRALDSIIEAQFPGEEVTLFGSRDSFLKYYTGKHLGKELPEVANIAATQMREKVKPIPSADFRAGMIYSAMTHPALSLPAAHVAIRHTTEEKVLLVRTPHQKKWSFPGVSVEVSDMSFESALEQYIQKEFGGIQIGELSYLASSRINDIRYQKSPHQVVVALFNTTLLSGTPESKLEMKWQDSKDLLESVTDAHKPLAEKFLAALV